MRKFFTPFIALFVTSVSFAQTDCSDLYFSEYIEGSSNNKAIEVYNPTSSAIDLSVYGVALFSNGATTTTNVLVMKGMLPSGGVYKIVNASADASLTGQADTTHSVTYYNGDDALVLGKYNGLSFDTLDIIGVVGNDPGTNWTVGSGATSEYTLVRNSGVKHGTTKWKNASSEWDVYSQNEFGYFGAHTSDCIKGSKLGKVSFAGSSLSLKESVGSQVVYVKIDTVAPSASVEVSVSAMDVTATNGVEYSFSTKSITFTETSLMDSVILSVNDNTTYGGDVNFTLSLQVISGDAEGNIDSMNVVIVDDEYPMVSLKDLRVNDANGISLYDGKTVWSGGIVNTATSFNSGAVNIYFQSGGYGIGTFLSGLNYTPAVGDSIIILGRVSKFNGLTQFSTADSFAVISSGNSVVPKVVTSFSEANEGVLIKLENMMILDNKEWPATGIDNDFEISNGVDTFIIFVDRDTDIDGRDTFNVSFDVVGILGQYDRTSPYESGHQIIPRNWFDFYLSEYNLSIEELRMNDANGNPLYQNRNIRTRGVVNTNDNFRGSGLQISMQDNGWGVTLFGASTDYGYTNFASGDSIEVVGTLKEFSGLCEFDPISNISVIANGVAISPAIVDTLGEMEESKLIKFLNVWLVDTNEWKLTSSFNVHFTNGIETFEMRIDSDTDIPGMMNPGTRKFDLTGIGGQYDASAPKNSGYQIFPRNQTDFDIKVGTSEIPSLSAVVYPNPTNGMLNIVSHSPIKLVKVINLVGTEVLSVNMPGSSIDISDLNNGIYLVEAISANGESFTTRVIKK